MTTAPATTATATMTVVMPRPLRLLLLLGTPLLTGTLEVFHPVFLTTDDARWWLTLHVLQLAAIGVLGLALYVLTDALTGAERIISRLAAGMFAVCYGAFDSILGIATGSVELMVPTMHPELRAGAEEAIQVLFRSLGYTLIGQVGRWAWLVSVVVLAVGLARQRRPIAPLLLLIAGALSFWYTHERPSGPIGMYLCFLALLWLEVGPRRRLVTQTRRPDAAVREGVTMPSSPHLPISIQPPNGGE